MTEVDTAAVRRHVLTTHGEVVDAVRACAAASATAGTTDGRSDTSVVRQGTERRLRERGVWGRLPRVLASCVEATDKRLTASPVAAPPYVAATATGVVLRATLDGGRLVVAVDALAVDREGDRTVLRPRDDPNEALVRVEWR